MLFERLRRMAEIGSILIVAIVCVGIIMKNRKDELPAKGYELKEVEPGVLEVVIIDSTVGTFELVRRAQEEARLHYESVDSWSVELQPDGGMKIFIYVGPKKDRVDMRDMAFLKPTSKTPVFIFESLPRQAFEVHKNFVLRQSKDRYIHRTPLTGRGQRI